MVCATGSTHIALFPGLPNVHLYVRNRGAICFIMWKIQRGRERSPTKKICFRLLLIVCVQALGVKDINLLSLFRKNMWMQI